MEFELEDYRSGRIKKKVRNLNCVKSTGYNNLNNINSNYNKKKVDNEKNKTDNNTNNNIINTSNVNNTNANNTNKNNNKSNMEKPIYVNSKNNNYLITKLKKENENLRLIVSEYESNIVKYKINEKLIRQRKLDNGVRITRKSTNSKPQSITKSMNNISNFGNNTYSTNFYQVKSNNNKSNTNNNSLLINNKINESQNALNTKIYSMNSYIIHNKKIVKRRSKKSLSVFRSTSKNKSKNNNKNVYDKIKTNYKKISNNNNSNTSENNTEIKMKEKKPELNTNNMSNSRIYTLNNNNNNFISSKNVFTYKKKVSKNTDKVIQNNNNNANNICNTERKKTDANVSNTNANTENIKNIQSNNMNRNTCVFIPKKEFNLTWSRFPKKEEEASFENYLTEKNPPPQSVMMSSKNVKKIENRNHRKYMTKVSSKHKNSIDKFDNYRIKHKKDITPQKITINRKIISNKMKNNKNFFGSNNVSMKNIINIQQKNKKNTFEDNKNLYQSGINNSASNKMMSIHNNLLHDGVIYSHKKKDSISGTDSKPNNIDNTNDSIVKKNSYMNNSKYNVTINNINNCNYINLIQGSNKPEIKIIKKRINKNN